MPNKITLLGEKANDNRFITPEQQLEIALGDVREKGIWRHANKMLIVPLDATDGGYQVGYSLSNLSGSEAIALAEVFKTVMFAEMGYINNN